MQESPWDCVALVAMNHEQKPFDDKRVRRALTLALDRYEASKNLSRIAVVKEVGGIQVPGTPWATPPAELEKLAGYGRDIEASRAEARRLLREAGVPDGFAFTFKNRGMPQPYEPVAIWLIDQWRQIGLNVKQEVVEASATSPCSERGDFEVAMDAQCSFIVEPDIDLTKFQSTGISDNNYGRYKDPVLDDLFIKQARAVDPEERKRLLRAFEKRLLDEEAHYFYTLPVAPHRPAQRQGARLDDHAATPQPAARHGLAGGVGRTGRERRRGSSRRTAMGVEGGHADVLPPLYARWASEFLGGAIAAESAATCNDCAISPASAGRRAPSRRRSSIPTPSAAPTCQCCPISSSGACWPTTARSSRAGG